MSEKDRKYIQSKIAHMKRMGINAGINPETGSCQPDFVKAEVEERRERQERIIKRRKQNEQFSEDIE